MKEISVQAMGRLTLSQVSFRPNGWFTRLVWGLLSFKLETMVIAACNSSARMPQEFLSRFALHAHFPPYTRQEFVDVCRGFLVRAENCPEDTATLLGQLVYDHGLGDVRKARGAWQLMAAPTEEEAHRVVRLMLKYGDRGGSHAPPASATRRLL